MSDESPEEKLLRSIFGEGPPATARFEPETLPETTLSEASKERIKLRSQYANGMAISLFAVGVLGPVVAIMGTDGNTTARLVGLALTAIVCFGLSVALHLHAAKNLGELDQ